MNKIIMITGATSGFGRAIAVKFSKNGYDVIITGRRKERLENLEKELNLNKGNRVLSMNFDIRNRMIQRMLSMPCQMTGKISISLLTMRDWQLDSVMLMKAISMTGTG